MKIILIKSSNTNALISQRNPYETNKRTKLVFFETWIQVFPDRIEIFCCCKIDLDYFVEFPIFHFIWHLRFGCHFFFDFTLAWFLCFEFCCFLIVDRIACVRHIIGRRLDSKSAYSLFMCVFLTLQSKRKRLARIIDVSFNLSTISSLLPLFQ